MVINKWLYIMIQTGAGPVPSTLPMKKNQINLRVKNLGQCFSCHMKFGGPTLLSKVAIVGNKHNRMI